MKLLPLSIALVVALAACAQPSDTTPANDAAPASTAAAPSVATVAQAPAVETDAESPDDYELTMANIERWMAAQKNLAALVAADPAIEDETAMNISEEDSAQYAARMEASPKMRAAITQAGMSTHDFALTGEALTSTMMAVGAVDAGALKDIPEGLNPQNVEFYRSHKAEIEAKLKAFGAQG